MGIRIMIVWLDGKMAAIGELGLSPADRGFLLGDGLFETLRVRNGQPADWQPHMDRLRSGADVLALPLPEVDLKAAALSVIAANGIEEGSLRLTISRGPGPRGIDIPAKSQPTVLLSAAPAGPAPGPARLHIASIRRNDHSPASRLKTLNYLDNILAKAEARRHGADDALMLNTAGRPVCSAIANLFLVFGEQLVTPPVSEGVLPGITRAEILRRAPSLGLQVSEAPLALDQLSRADEVFLTNSLFGVRPVIAIGADEFPVGQMAARLGQALRAS